MRWSFNRSIDAQLHQMRRCVMTLEHICCLWELYPSHWSFVRMEITMWSDQKGLYFCPAHYCGVNDAQRKDKTNFPSYLWSPLTICSRDSALFDVSSFSMHSHHYPMLGLSLSEAQFWWHLLMWTTNSVVLKVVYRILRKASKRHENTLL